ncbi:RecX family transcriptional regulator [Treponema socranskii]|uniref:regulatory protein RecX n=1 Tax=Treponema socranskii TaxID=53419 RepID=UPI003D8F3A33
MVVSETKQVSSGCIKITTEEGPAFFIRKAYLTHLAPEAIASGSVFSGEDEEDIIDAGFCYAAESKALSYLARAEQSRFNLTRKLGAKGIEKRHIENALDYLEREGSLSDTRFARAWLDTRKINHTEGRSRLASELAFRGISREVADAALDEFFSENSEEEICKKALEKCKRRRMREDKIINYLRQHGFSQKTIRSAANESEL